MPVKSATKKAVVNQNPVPAVQEATRGTSPKRSNKIMIITLAVIVLAILLWKFKTLFVVAIVNGRPVTRYELEQKLMGRYGKQTLDEIVSERLVTEKAQEDKVMVTANNIEAKIADLTKMLAGRTSLEAALEQQGMTMEEFRRQVYLQALVEKIAEPQVKIDDKEIADYIEQNQGFMTATEEGAIREEAVTALKRQKTSEIFAKIFADLKAKAKVINLLTLQTAF